MIKLSDVVNYDIEYDYREYPKMCDSFISSAYWPGKFGRALTDEELEDLNETAQADIYEEAAMLVVGG